MVVELVPEVREVVVKLLEVVELVEDTEDCDVEEDPIVVVCED